MSDKIKAVLILIATAFALFLALDLAARWPF
jgi:hypothetical protein